jgi:hypothetical protein
MLSPEQKADLLIRAQEWFLASIAENHISNTVKLKDPKQFIINPFLSVYLANFLEGNSSPESIAKALIYPRVLGTSITTSFGTHIQRFAKGVLGGFGSGMKGIDIEFDDQIDGRHKYCQIKAGPNTLNHDDVPSVVGHFDTIRRTARTNDLDIRQNDLIVGVIYGEAKDLSRFYLNVTSSHHFPVYVGAEFWVRLTGDPTFYSDLIDSIGLVAIETDFSNQLREVIQTLAESDEIIALSKSTSTAVDHDDSSSKC